MRDSSGRGHDGVYQNGIALRRDGATNCERRPHPPRVCELAAPPGEHSPLENKAAYFPARDGHGYVNGITAPTSGYTMEAWVKPRDGQNMMVMAHGGGGQLFINGGNLAFRQTQDTIYSNGAVPPGVWSHVAASWDGHTSRLYVNGHEVATSTSANKPPSGTSTFYIGYGDQAPWFHGDMDEAAYYDYALSAHRIGDRYKVGTAKDKPSLVAGNSPFNTEGPFTDPAAPKNNGIYAPTKVPDANYSCTDPDDVPGDSDIATCEAYVDGSATPTPSGDPLPNSIGTHTFEVVAIDEGGNHYHHTHTYRVLNFGDLYDFDNPIAYYRLAEGTGPGTQPMNDASGNGHNGEYKNGTDSGPVGISGDNDHARRFTGADGYGYVNGIEAPRYQSTMAAWINADDGRNQSIVGHGDAGEIYIAGGTFHFRRMGETVHSSVGVNPGHWQQVAATWDGVDIRIYVDGQLTGITESTKRPSSSSTFYIGYGELAPWFKGDIDEVVYYPIAQPPARIFQLWLADPPPDLNRPVGPSDPVDPVDPADPSDPVDPVDPTDPDDPTDPTDPPVDPVDPSDPPVDPVDPTDPPVDPVDPTDPETSTACDKAGTDLAKAERKLKQAKAKVKKLKKKQKHAAKAKPKQKRAAKAKLKKAKAKARLAQLAVEQAESAVDARC